MNVSCTLVLVQNMQIYFPCKMHLAHNIYFISAMYCNLDITKSITRAFGCILYTTYNSIFKV